MKNGLHVTFEYEITAAMLNQYEREIPQILSKLSDFDAAEIRLLQYSTNPCRIVETFVLPTVAHYFSLKKLRKSKKHVIFHKLDSFIPGGLKSIESFAIMKRD